MRIELPERLQPVPEPEGVCPICHGSGWRKTSEEGAGAVRRCDCEKEKLGPRLLGLAGIPERYQSCTLESFKVHNRDPGIASLLLRARTVSQAYVDEFYDAKDDRFSSTGLIFVGPPGIGKTHLAAAVLRELIVRHRVRGRFVDFTSLLHQIQATFDNTSGESKSEILEGVKEAELLVLDELGVQKPTEWVMQTLYDVINARYSRRRPTIFTTNYLLELPARAEPKDKDRSFAGSDASVKDFDDDVLTREQKQLREIGRRRLLESRISAPLVSRICEMAQPVELTGLDYRREVKAHQHRIGR